MDTVLPKGVAAAAGAKTYVSDSVTHSIRRLVGGVGPALFAGKTGEAGSADGGASVTASFHTPRDIGFDTSGNLYVADDHPFGQGTAIRRIAPDGTVTTFAGALTASGTADGTGRFGAVHLPESDGAGCGGQLLRARRLHGPESDCRRSGDDGPWAVERLRPVRLESR